MVPRVQRYLPVIMSVWDWGSNAALVRACASLGYLPGHVLDPTFGRGRFWALWEPEQLTAHDLTLDGVDFRELPERCGTFDAVAFDPPYKLNGTPVLGDFDAAYGLAQATNWQDRMQLCRDGIAECWRVLKVGGFLLMKCQDQVCWGKVRWQTDDFSAHAIGLGMEKVDRLDMMSYRAQPKGRHQVHARRNTSTMLVFRKKGG